MKNLLKYAALISLLIGTGQTAFASTLDGSISFVGAASDTATGFNFSRNPAASRVAVDGLAPSAPTEPNISFAVIHPGTSALKSNAGAQSLQYKVSSYGTANGKLIFFGTLTPYSSAPESSVHQNSVVPGTTEKGLLLAYPQNTANMFSATLATAPEPNSLVLLGTGLIGAAVLMLRRRRIA